MIKFRSLSSGSCGNCYYLGYFPDTKDGASFQAAFGILIDAGVSIRRLKKNLLEMGLTTDNVSAVLVTHDHLDHIYNLGSYCKRLSKPVWTTPVLHDALSRHTFTREWIASCRNVLSPDWNTVCPGVEVKWFEVPHDATQTVGYHINFMGYQFVIMTDVGEVTPEAYQAALQASTIVLESNYDLPMLLTGPYPQELRQRIFGGHGHLSNDECADALRRMWHPGLKNVFLCHLSENNNTPDLAFASARGALDEVAGAGNVYLRCLPRTYPSDLFLLE
ncbi:MAG: MBL fold metallo-hydrolase [Bacteroidales bacterium]|nr:MBL fold metallo-hydrolase [Bacteroidales bacterium]